MLRCVVCLLCVCVRGPWCALWCVCVCRIHCVVGVVCGTVCCGACRGGRGCLHSAINFTIALTEGHHEFIAPADEIVGSGGWRNL